MRRIPIINSILNGRLITLISLLIITSANAQVYEIKGSIIDAEFKQPISEVNIIIKETNKGTYSNKIGEFNIITNNLPLTLTISHIGYISQQIEVTNTTKEIKIRLVKDIIPLSSVDISANKIKNMVENQKLYIIDYAVNNDSLLILCYNQRHTNEGQVVLMNDNNKIISRKNIKHINSIEEDFKQQQYIIGKNMAREVAVRNQLIELEKEWDLEEFKKVQKSIIAYSSPFYYLRQNIADNQIVKLYKFNENTQKLELLKTITDNAGLERLSDKARLQSAANYTPADARFEEMCFYAPKYIPMIFKDNLFYLFNFEEDKIEIIDTTAVILNNISISFHHQKHWKKQILIDKVKGNMYAVFEKNGFYYISEIDVEKGVIGEKISIPHFVYIEKIKVNNGKVYFLYKGNIDNKYKELYSMKI